MERSSGPLRDLVGLFLRLGATAFGGPAAHISMMEHEVGLAALLATFFVHELVLLLVAGCVSAGVAASEDFLRRGKSDATALAPPEHVESAEPHAPSRKSSPKSSLPLSKKSFFLPLFSLGIPLSSFSLTSLFFFFLKTGAVLFGSGYVLLAYLKADLVERWHWLTSAQLLDAVAVGQFTPGPLSSTATFIGYLLGGLPGAGVATLGIFLPAFAFVALMGPFVPRLRRSKLLGAFLDGVNVAALALMGSVTLQFARPALTSAPTVALFLASIAILSTTRVNAAWLVLAGGLLGVVFG